MDMIRRHEGPAWPEVERSIDEMVQISRQRGIHFGVLYFPFQEEITGVCPSSAHDGLMRFCRNRGVPVLDMREIFKAVAPAGELYLEKDDIHLNRAGHEAAARAMAPWFTERVLSDKKK